MCPTDESDRTIEFKDYFIITPSITFGKKKSINYFRNILGELGKKVKKNFEYSSDKNKEFMTIKEIKEINNRL